jgi:cytochrome c-type biogenesis protein CcmF
LNAALGRSGVLLGFAAAVVGVLMLAVGLATDRPALRRNASLYAWLVLGGAVVAAGAMEHALLTHDFSISYVADNNSRKTPLLFTITGMWSALEGSILLWALVLSGYLAVMVRRFRRRATDPLVGWATLVVFSVAVFFFGLMLGPANPFRTIGGQVPSDGLGPNPLLQDHPLVAFHPPLLYLGFVGFTVPFAFAVAALVTGRLGEGWLMETRRFTLFAWGFLTIGIVLGAWWSYQVLGWGGFWAWDPVENAAFVPWLCATAYLHSVMVQERRGILRVWNLSLLIATFSLTILGTFLTRSGVIESVHAFSDSTLGPLLLGFFGLVVAVGVGLIAWRGDRLRSPGGIDTLVSREGAFLANNLVFAVFAFVVLLGTVFPLLAQSLRGAQISVGRPYFDEMTRPLGLALLFLMAVAPVLPWRKAGAETLSRRLWWPAWAGTLTVLICVVAGVRGFVPLLTFGLGAFAATSALRQLAVSTRRARQQGAGAVAGLLGRSNGGMVVHLGVIVIAVALAASLSYGHREQVHIGSGRSARFSGHTLTYLGVHRVVAPNRTATVASVRVDGKDVLEPAVSRYGNDSEGVATPAVATGFVSDVYLSMANEPSGKAPLLLSVVVQPMVLWLWIGGLVVAVGTVMAAFSTRRERRRDMQRAPRTKPEPPVDAGRDGSPEEGEHRPPSLVAAGSTEGGGDR